MIAGDAVTTAAVPVVVVEQYRAFLIGERGLAAESVRCYCNHAQVFLAQLPDPVDTALAGLSARQVTEFVVGYCRGRNTWSAKAMVTGLRSLLRFLHVAGWVRVPLVGAVPSVASLAWRLAATRRWTAAQVKAMLASCDLGDRGGFA